MWARFNTEVSYNLIAVKFGAFGFAGIFAGKFPYSFFELVECFVEGRYATRVPRSAVTANQIVEVPEERSPVSRIATHRAVTPAICVTLEPPRKEHQLRYFAGQLLLVTQLRHAFTSDSGTNSFVMPKRDPSVFI
jgi:hypothetical protein